MPGIKQLVSLISNEVVSQLATVGITLTDGRILLGRQHQFEQSSPNRIIFTPTGSNFDAKDVYNRSVTASRTEQLLQFANRSVLSDMINFEVRCWGVSPDQNPDDDFDYTQALYQQVIRSVHLMTVGSYEISNGKWTDATFASSQLVRDGREFVFQITFGTPITALITPLPQAPNDVSMQATDSLTTPAGTEPGCEEPTP